jgi:hypothetical protein
MKALLLPDCGRPKENSHGTVNKLITRPLIREGGSLARRAREAQIRHVRRRDRRCCVSIEGVAAASREGVGVWSVAEER